MAVFTQIGCLGRGPGFAALQGTMIWFYERRGTHLRCEVRETLEGDRYELVITDPQGIERVETFSDSKALTRRSRQLEDEWRTEGWDGPYMRFL